jgi:RNA polymerase sigma-70 factor (ECF subfamily)
MSDFELLRAWRAGSRDAGDALITRHMPAVLRFFASKIPQAASDLSQQTFLGAVEARDRIDEQRSFRAYLFGIARNRLLLHLHGRKGVLVAPDTTMQAVDAASPSAVLAARQEQRVLLGALRRIPLDHQIALELYYWEDLSTVEIAEVLGVAQGTVRSRLARARSLLREQIEASDAAADVRTATLQDFEAWARSLARP